MTLPKHLKDCGFVDWSFFTDKQGNPYTVIPTAKMITGYEIHIRPYREFVPSGKKKQRGYYKDPVELEVYYDRSYVEAYRDKFKEVYDVLSLLEERNEPVKSDIFADFETKMGVVPNSKNPRHSLYLKLKEFMNHA